MKDGPQRKECGSCCGLRVSLWRDGGTGERVPELDRVREILWEQGRHPSVEIRVADGDLGLMSSLSLNQNSERESSRTKEATNTKHMQQKHACALHTSGTHLSSKFGIETCCGSEAVTPIGFCKASSAGAKHNTQELKQNKDNERGNAFLSLKEVHRRFVFVCRDNIQTLSKSEHRVQNIF